MQSQAGKSRQEEQKQGSLKERADYGPIGISRRDFSV